MQVTSPSPLSGQDLSYTRMDTEKGFLRQMNNWAEGGRRQAMSQQLWQWRRGHCLLPSHPGAEVS